MLTTYDPEPAKEREVIGIMKDFNFQSLKDPIQPMAIILGYQPNWEMAVRLTPGDTNEKLALIKTIWKKHASQAPFEYTFLDKNFDLKQEAEKRVSQLFVFFTILAIVIACLGLFGLTTFTAEQRTKEIGIRKALGATMMEIGVMLNYDILRTGPLCQRDCLAGKRVDHVSMAAQFAYHVSLKPWFFLLAGFITVSIAFLSVSYHAVRVARSRPVSSLRSE
ncbi:MAG: FtsX-like permease family protein [Bacteroidota bacterium]